MWSDTSLQQYVDKALTTSSLQIPPNTVLIYEYLKHEDVSPYTLLFNQKGWICKCQASLQHILEQWLQESFYQPLALQYAFRKCLNQRYKHLPLIGHSNIFVPLLGTVSKNDYCWMNLLSLTNIQRSPFGSLCFISHYQPLQVPIYPKALHEKVRKALWMYREVLRLFEKISVIHEQLCFYTSWDPYTYIGKQYQYILNHEVKYPYLSLQQLYHYYLEYQQKQFF